MKEHPFIKVILNQSFCYLWLGQITSQIAFNMLSFILAIRVYQETNSNLAVSFLILMFSLPSVFFGIIAGGIVDHFDKRDVLVFCNFFRFILFILFYFFPNNILAIYTLVILFSIITQIFIPAEAPSIPFLVSQSQLLAANSLFAVTFYTSTSLGFVLAGPFLRIFGNSYVYLFMAIIMFFSVFFVYKLPKIGKRCNKPLKFLEMIESIREGLLFIKENERIKTSLVLMTIAQALIMTLSVLAPGFADRVMSIEIEDSSYLVMGPAVFGLIVGAVLIGIWGSKFLKRVLIYSGLISTGTILFFIFLISIMSKGHIIYLILLFFLGFFNSFITIPASTILQQDSTGEVRGRVYGVLTSVTGGISLVPVLISGILADTIGVSQTMAIIGSIIIFSCIYYNNYKKGQDSR